jgi:hypothetical protein
MAKTTDANQLGETPFSAVLAGSMAFADGNRLDNVPEAIVRIRVVPSVSFSGAVYLDTDNNGIRQTDPVSGAAIELGIPNVEIQLFRQGQTTPLAITSTGADGSYHFENLVPGTYRVKEIQPAAFLDGRESLGVILPGRVTRGTVGPDEFTNVELRANEHAIDYNFGEIGLRPERITKRLFLTSTPPLQQVVAQQAGLTAVTIAGTPGPDTIVIDSNDQRVRVQVNNGRRRNFRSPSSS